MSGNMVLSPDQVFHLERDVFEREAVRHFGEAHARVYAGDEGSRVVASVYIDRPDETTFQVFYAPDAIWTDGTPEQSEEVAMWLCTLLPENPGGRIWLTDEGFSGHVELAPAMSVDDLRNGWVDHEEHPPEL